ncbi:head GIN domain-containing protein [Sphingomicrobium nitratireducens]|uniref:head GIN domain-containing protein n=1 Tax=Sphingomicrobium nitratireducens TaxID=2964666 RepID=UPI00223FC406|nr:head GIN domain-containing protein [Sphingomicrobium nitratireducens]
MIMKTFASMAALMTGALGGCVDMGGDSVDMSVGAATSQVVQVEGFDRLEVAGPYDVTVTPGDALGLTADGPENVIRFTEFKVEDGKLTIRPMKKEGDRIRWEGNAVVKIAITGAMLKAAGIAGSGDIDIAQVSGDRFDGDIAGSGSLMVRQLAVKTAEFDIAGSGDMAMAGTADSIDVDIAGSGSFAANELVSKAAQVEIAGSGDVATSVTDTADISIAGSGDVAISGGAKCTVSKAGSGNVVCS